MAEYDFHTLSPTDFEMLVCQLLRAKLGIELHAFANGPDGGVDLRSTADGVTVVVQCKHYRGSSFNDLRRAARQEMPKMDLVRPNEYMFVTSQDLTLTQKESLFRDLQPWLKDPDDLLAMRDLNVLLSEYPSVEKSNFKLWMASAGVLQRIVNSGLWERSVALPKEKLG